MNDNNHLIEALTGSKVYKDYERAFTDATGLPVTLRSVESWQLPHHGRRNENPFCALLAQKSRSCAACLQVQQTLSETATHEARTVTCSVGLNDSAVPVRLGDKLIGFLQTGQVFRKKPTSAQFERTAKQVLEWGVAGDPRQLREAYLSRVRIEKSKNLLLNPNLRVSEIAFEVGFQSLTHFNRVFKKILGQSPTEYRSHLLGR